MSREYNEIHHSGIITGAMASQITSLTIVYSIVYSGADQRKYQSSAWLVFVRGIHRGPVNSPHNGPVTRKTFPFDNDIMMHTVRHDLPCLLRFGAGRFYLYRLGSLHWLGVHLTPSEAALRTADAYIKRIWSYDDVIKWKHFLCYWPCVRGIHRSPVNSPHKVQWRGALMFFFICAWINGWVNNRGAGDWRRNRAHYDVAVMRNLNNTVHNKSQ